MALVIWGFILAVASIAVFFWGAVQFIAASTVYHQIVAVLFWLISAVLFVGGCVVQAIELLRRDVQSTRG